MEKKRQEEVHNSEMSKVTNLEGKRSAGVVNSCPLLKYFIRTYTEQRRHY